MDSSKKSNKIRDIVRLQQILKKWKKVANINNTSTRIKFFKKTLSFSELMTFTSSSMGAVVPKGYVAVCVGKELKRFVIPTEYLSHKAFEILLREAEEEFGFEQEGVLKFPCEVELFDNILKMMGEKKFGFIINGSCDRKILFTTTCGADTSPNIADLTPSSYPYPHIMCR